MEWEAGLVVAALCAVGGLLVPRIIAAVPEPEPDPTEEEGDFPDKIPYADIARGRHLTLWCGLAGAVVGAAIGLACGWSWGLLWLVPLVPVGIALAIIDYLTWYLPTVVIAPSYLVSAVLVGVAALVHTDAGIALGGVIGWFALGGYYGLLHLLSPRMMARGDVRLAGLLGLCLGPYGGFTLFASVVLAALTMLVAIVPMTLLGRTIKRDKGVVAGLGKRHLPYGPFLLSGALLALLLGRVLAHVLAR